MAEIETPEALIDLALQHDDELNRLIDLIPSLHADLIETVRARVAEMSAADREHAVQSAVQLSESLKTDLSAKIAHAEDRRRAGLAEIRSELARTVAALPTPPTPDEIAAISERIAAQKAGEVREFSAKSAADLAAKIELAADATSRGQGVTIELAFVSAFKGTFDPSRGYIRGEIFAYRGGCYVTLADSSPGEAPTRKNQKEPNPKFAILSAPGAPGVNGQDGGGGGTKTIRSDTVSATNYIGSAPSGTATSATTWALTKIVVAAAGTTTVTHATDSWNNHLTATYS